MAESKEELKSLSRIVKEDSEKVGLKLTIQKTKIMASDPIISWQIDGEKMAIVRDFVRQSHWKWWLQAWNRKMLALGRKAVTNLNSILKSRDITLPTKSIYSNLCCFFFFSKVMGGCENWTIKKAEHQRIDVFELWCWRKLLGVPWTSSWSNQSVLKKISPEYSLEGLMLKLKLQYFGHLKQRTDSFENLLDAGKDWRQEEKEMRPGKMVLWHHRLNGHEFE